MASNYMEKLQREVRRIKRTHPGAKHQTAIKQAAKNIRNGIAGVGSVKTKKKPVKRVTVVNIGSPKRKHKKNKSMAKTRKRGRSRSRSRSMSGVNFGGYMPIVMLTAGAIGGGVLAGMAGNMMAGKASTKTIGFGQLGVGILGAGMLRKHPLGLGAGIGFAAVGGRTLLSTTGILKGIAGEDSFAGDDDDMGYEDDMSGEEEMSGEDDNVSGADDDM